MRTSLQGGVAPQLIAEAFNIKPPHINVPPARETPQFQDVSKASTAFFEALELGLSPKILKTMLKNILENATTADICKFIVDQALYLDYRNVALAVTKKMATML